MKPKRYKAKEKNGAWVVGWYVELHLPRYDDKNPNRIIGYDTIPALFNDEEGERSKGCYWHTIDPATMQEVNDDTQLTLFQSKNMETRTREQDETHWKDVRERAAIAALQGLLADSSIQSWDISDFAGEAVEYANALVEELKKQDSQILADSAKTCKDEQKQALIDKACEWLSNNMYEGTCEQILSKKPYPSMRNFIKEFKQAMKGEENNE